MCCFLDYFLKQFDDFERRLNIFCRQQVPGVTDSLTERKTVLVRYTKKDGKTGGQWRRGTVVRIDR